MVAALILAAGRSERMGRPKALLKHVFTGRTFVAHLISTAREAGLPAIFVIGRSANVELEAEVNEMGVALLVNAAPDRGQLSSIMVGVEAAERLAASAVLVMPVDVPLVTSTVLSRVLTAANRSEAQIVRATHAGQHGHPVLFKRSVFGELRSADPSIGARAIVRADPARVLDVEVSDPGVVLDVDTPEDYRRAFGVEL
jgi:CTP:molybdopterin cytidylyltransferase MocA